MTFYDFLRKSFLALFLIYFLAVFSGCYSEEGLWSGVNEPDIFDESEPVLDEMLVNLARADLRVMRIWIDFRLEIDENGNTLPVGTYNPCIVNEIDELMVKARDKGILLMPVFHQANWLINDTYPVNAVTYGWRNCRTPVNLYNEYLSTGETQYVHFPYRERGWTDSYLTDPSAKNAYKQRVNYLLNHVNPYIGRPWKEINDVIWSWELQNEPEYITGTGQQLRDWLKEMSSYVKSIDPDTYVSLGTMYFNTFYTDAPENTMPDIITDADIYTTHLYGNYSDYTVNNIQNFQNLIGFPSGKLLMVEETNGEAGRHTPGNREPRYDSSTRYMESGIPWMFWEYGYKFDDDDIWYANKTINETTFSDGVMWGAKVVPGAKKMWETQWIWNFTGKKWKVHDMVDALCAMPGSACERDIETIFFLDTFNSGVLDPGYTWFDRENTDTYSLTDGYLRIEASLFEDLWGGSPVKRGAPLMLHNVPSGNYMIETFLTADPAGRLFYEIPSQGINTQAGLFVFQDVTDWMFFGLTNHSFPGASGNGLIITLTEDDNSSIIYEYPMTSDYAFLRIEKTGPTFKFYWKLENNENWHLLTSLEFLFTGNHTAGMGVKSLDVDLPVSKGIGNFDYFLIKNGLQQLSYPIDDLIFNNDVLLQLNN